jgi:uncharacterized Zn-finger protein
LRCLKNPLEFRVEFKKRFNPAPTTMRITSTIRKLPLGAITVLGLASCSLPPDAWRQIRQEGLITYLVNDRNIPSSSPSPAASGPMVAQTTTPAPSVAPTIQSVPAPSQLDANSMPVAQVVPGLDGYVRSPFTNPPRLVDVRGMTAGSKVVCPYTRRPFLVPSMGAANQAVASTPSVKDEPPTQPVTKSEPAPAAPTKPTPAPTAPSKVASVTTPTPQPPPAVVKPQPQTQAKSNTPAPQQTPPPVVAPKTAAAELPFGVPIPGRPGFVNSPYAAKHQLVDVTGLPTGMEVKCPYTGKLFRVPPQANSGAKN